MMLLLSCLANPEYQKEVRSKGYQKNTKEAHYRTVNEIGNDNQPKLNECESKCLNYEFQLKRGTFDFYDKNVCFFTGNTGQYKVSKAWYFGIVKRHIELYDTLPLDRNSQLIFFDQEESKRTGYDAVVICQSKKLITKKELLKRLGK